MLWIRSHLSFLLAVVMVWATFTLAALAGRKKHAQPILMECGSLVAPPNAAFPDLVCLGFCSAESARLACRYNESSGPYYPDEPPLSGITSVAVRLKGHVTLSVFASHLQGHTGWAVKVDEDLPDWRLGQLRWTGTWDNLPAMKIRFLGADRLTIQADEASHTFVITRRNAALSR